jgi:hypothetical protein
MGQKNLLIREELPESKPPCLMKDLPILGYIGFAGDKKLVNPGGTAKEQTSLRGKACQSLSYASFVWDEKTC